MLDAVVVIRALLATSALYRPLPRTPRVYAMWTFPYKRLVDRWVFPPAGKDPPLCRNYP